MATQPKKTTTRTAFDYDREALVASPFERDNFTVRDLMTSVAVFGRSGSGKSSTVLRAIAKGVFKDCAILALTPKTADVAYYREEAERAGRADKVRLLGPDQPHRMALFQEECAAAHPTMRAETFVHMLNQVFEAYQGGKGETDFWTLAVKDRIRRVALLIQFAGEIPSLQRVERIVQSLPRTQADIDNADFQAWSEWADYMGKAIDREQSGEMDASEMARWKQLQRYFTVTLPDLPEATRESINITHTSYVSPLTQGVLGECLFSNAPNLTTRQAFEDGLIVIPAMAVKEFGDVARVAQILLKFAFGKSRERYGNEREGDNTVIPWFAFADEYHLFASASSDPLLLSTTRSSKAGLIAATQSVSALYEQFDPRKAQYQVNTVLSNMVLKIALNLNDHSSQTYLAENLGREWKTRVSTNIGRSMAGMNPAGGGMHRGQSLSESYQFFCEPSVFSELNAASFEHPFSEAVLWFSGKTFESNGGKHFCFTGWDRNGACVLVEPAPQPRKAVAAAAPLKGMLNALTRAVSG